MHIPPVGLTTAILSSKVCLPESALSPTEPNLAQAQIWALDQAPGENQVPGPGPTHLGLGHIWGKAAWLE